MLTRIALSIVLVFVALFATLRQAHAIPYSTLVLADGPVGYWRLGEAAGPTAADTASAAGLPQQGAQDGTYTGGFTLGTSGALTASGDTDTAATFNGSTGLVGIGAANETFFDFSTADGFTLEAWLRTTDTSTFQGLVSKWSGTGYFMAAFNPDSDGDLSLLVQIQSGGSDYAFAYTPEVGGVNLADAAWHHVAFTHAAGGTTSASLSLYVDGVLQTGLSAGDSGTVGSILNGVEVQLAARDGSLTFGGDLDEAAIYPRQLTGAEILAHYLAGTSPPVTLVIPEPSTLALVAIAGLIAMVTRRRKRASKPIVQNFM